MEQTLSIIKPDAVERNLANKIKAFLEKKNFKYFLSNECEKFPE